MIKLELELTDIDYNALLPLIRERLEKTGNPMAGMLAGGFGMIPDSMKDRLAAEMLNANGAALTAQLENIAAMNGIQGKVRNFRATADRG